MRCLFGFPKMKSKNFPFGDLFLEKKSPFSVSRMGKQQVLVSVKASKRQVCVEDITIAEEGAWQ